MKPRRAQLALVLALALIVSGCARLFDHYDVGPTGLARADERLRRMIATAPDSTALARVATDDDALPSDPLLARLYGGVLAYHAGRYDRAAALLDSATLIIDERMTPSASRAALSIISTDRVLPYQAGTAERLLLHYYAALAWLRAGAPEDAAVEARRMSALLERQQPSDDAQRRLHGAMRHVAAALFALAGEAADADVAWRNGRALLGDSAAQGLPRPVSDSIDVFLLIDRGFVGHRAEQSISLWLPGDEVRRLRGDDDGRVGMATMIASRITAAAEGQQDSFAPLHVPAPRQEQTPHASRASAGPEAAASPTAVPAAHGTGAGFATGTTAGHAHEEGEDDEKDEENAPYLMRIAWPVFRDLAPPLGSVRVHVDSVEHAPLVRASISSAVASDLRQDRTMLVARTVARAAAKLALTRGIEDELREKDDAAADLFALVGNLTAVVTEQADTRSWTLLPGAIEVARVRVPAGTSAVHVDVNGRSIRVPLSAHGRRILVEHLSLR